MSERAPHFLIRLSRLPAASLVLLVRVYQRTLSPALPVFLGPTCGCRFSPTCSHYAVDALRMRGAVIGTWLTVVRLLNPNQLTGLTPTQVASMDMNQLRALSPEQLQTLADRKMITLATTR